MFVLNFSKISLMLVFQLHSAYCMIPGKQIHSRFRFSADWNSDVVFEYINMLSVITHMHRTVLAATASDSRNNLLSTYK